MLLDGYKFFKSVYLSTILQFLSRVFMGRMTSLTGEWLENWSADNHTSQTNHMVYLKKHLLSTWKFPILSPSLCGS